MEKAYCISQSWKRPQDVTAEMVREILLAHDKIEYEFNNLDRLSLFVANACDNFTELEVEDCLQLVFKRYDASTDLCEQVNIQYFDERKPEVAIEDFLKRLKAEVPVYLFSQGIKLEHLWVRKHQELKFISHYDYCDFMLNPFFQEVFGKTADALWCGGMVGAHGDKCYQYKREWNKADIPFKHGALLFLLTYTKAYGDRPKPESCEWVIENYKKYLPQIEAAEKAVLAMHFS